jgi:large subunit ribosomal protein L32e
MTEKKDTTKADATKKAETKPAKAAKPPEAKVPKTKPTKGSKASEASKEKASAATKVSKPSEKKASRPAAKKESEPSEKKAPKAADKKETDAKQEPSKKTDDDEDDVTIVDEGDDEAPVVHTPRIKPELDDETRVLLAKRREIDGRRPAFRRQQWFEYKRLSRTGWRKPTGQDSAQRRHYVYRPPVVRIGFRGPAAVRGLHPSGFEEVRVERPKDLEAIDPKKQAARVSATVGKRKLKDIYKEADKRKIRVLNRRSF